jgi:citrate synthase
MARGTPPTERAARMLDTCLVLHADHTMSASTCAARVCAARVCAAPVCAAALSDMHSAVVGARGALQGRRHGGANEQIMHTLEAIRKSADGDAALNAVAR